MPTQYTCESNPEPVIPRDDIIQEEDSSSMPPPVSSTVLANRKYVWRIDLAKTEQHWFGWFKGLSTAFLNVSAPKMLLLAGVDRLDRELTVGQMQGIYDFQDRLYNMLLLQYVLTNYFSTKTGKFQMQVLPACGHAVHEDVPDKVAEAIATFMVRHKFAEPASDFPR